MDQLKSIVIKKIKIYKTMNITSSQTTKNWNMFAALLLNYRQSTWIVINYKAEQEYFSYEILFFRKTLEKRFLKNNHKDIFHQMQIANEWTIIWKGKEYDLLFY